MLPRMRELIYVVKAWIEKGLNSKGYKVCKFAFKVSVNDITL